MLGCHRDRGARAARGRAGPAGAGALRGRQLAGAAEDDAELAEDNAADALDYAAWAVDQAEVAVLDAADARAWADTRAAASPPS